jgi:spore germination cell wall hydrolase CwlJ-like protein
MAMAELLDNAIDLPEPGMRPIDAAYTVASAVSLDPAGAAPVPVIAATYAASAPATDTLAMLSPQEPPEAPRSAPASPMNASARERDCLMRAMYFESRRNSPEGLLAVGTVVMNRVDHGAWGKSICGVVGAKRQFAPGVMTRRMQGDLTDLTALADRIMAGKRHPKITPKVMFFHVAGMTFPYKNMRYVHVAGGNTFYFKAERKRRRG